MIAPYYEDKDAGIVIYLGDCREILPTIEERGVLILTDPPYLTEDSQVPIIGIGVEARRVTSNSVGSPWGYSLDWIESCEKLQPSHWVVFANYKMIGGLCSRLAPSAIFVWQKSNAPRMTRPVPRLDCEFIVWSRAKKSTCGRMGEFKSQVLSVPMPQAGCMASERFLARGSKAALHPCQKPVAVVAPFIERLNPSLVVDPFMGTGTSLYAAKQLGYRAIGIEIEEKYCKLAVQRLAQGVLYTAE